MQKITLVCKVDDLKTEGWAERRDLSQGERMQRAGKIMGIFLGVAFLTVFIPVLHFILPPLMLIIGGVLAFNEFSSKGEVLSGEITCPNCKKVMRLQRESEGWPRSLRCDGCSFALLVDRA